MTTNTGKDEGPSQEFFFRTSGTGNGPWEFNRPQKTIVQLVQRGVFHGEILDIGCGIADNAIYIASHVKDVNITGIDLGPKAIEVAREKAEKAKVNIEFEVMNLLDDLSKTTLKKNGYDIILDAGVFHVFTDEDRLRVINNLQYLIKPGGLYIQLCYSEKETRPGGPRRMKTSVLNDLFSSTNGWKIESIEDSVYESSLRGGMGIDGDGQAYLTFIRRHQSA